MTDYRHAATAHVQVTVEVDVGSNWGGDCTVAQVHKQAEEEAIGCIRNLLSEARTSVERGLKDRAGRITIIGKPKVTAVLAVREQQ